MAKLQDLGKIVLSAINSKAVLSVAGEEAVRSIQTRTRTGKGVTEANGSPTKLPKLKPKTVANRRSAKNTGKATSEFFSPKKSNLTLTGQMIESVSHKAINGEVSIILNNDEAKRKAGEVLKVDPRYEFMNLSKAEVTRMVRVITAEVTAILRKINFTGF